MKTCDIRHLDRFSPDFFHHQYVEGYSPYHPTWNAGPQLRYHCCRGFNVLVFKPSKADLAFDVDLILLGKVGQDYMWNLDEVSLMNCWHYFARFIEVINLG